MSRPARTVAATLLLPPLLLGAAAPAAAHGGGGPGGPPGGTALPAAYQLTGDPGGSQFEGIAVDRRQHTFYVTETTGGEVHRADVRDATPQVWLDEDEAARVGRSTALGIGTDTHGRVYVVGGPEPLDLADLPANDVPRVWVYDQHGNLLGAPGLDRGGRDPVFLNDVVVAPDGAAYVTNSYTPQVYRLAVEDGQWRMRLWADASDVIEQTDTIGLNGIEVAPDGQSLVVAQLDTGALWRFDLRTAEVTQVDTGGADLVSVDGLAVDGTTLYAVRNTAARVAVLRLDPHARSAQLLAQVPTDPDRFLTTADVVGDRLLVVDSQFDEDPPAPPYEVITLPLAD